MSIRRIVWVSVLALVFLPACQTGPDGTRGFRTIQGEDMAFHLKFLSAEEFRGRNAPSIELDIASKYIALTAERIGLKPLMPEDSYYQEIPVEVTMVAEQDSVLRLTRQGKEQLFGFPQSFGTGRYPASGRVGGEILFLGFGLSAPDLGWDDLAGLDLKGKIVVLLDVSLPEDHVLKPGENRRLLRMRAGAARAKGAVASITIINEEREKRFIQEGLSFDKPERYGFPDIVTGTGAVPSKAVTAKTPAVPPRPFFQVDVRHDVGAAILGIETSELEEMIVTIREGEQVAPRRPGGKLEIAMETHVRRTKTLNVSEGGFLLEGEDPMAPGSTVQFELQTLGKESPLQCVGKVAHVSVEPSRRRYRFGVSILHMSHADQHRYRRLIMAQAA